MNALILNFFLKLLLKILERSSDMIFIMICDCIPHPRSLWVGWRCQLHLFDGESRVDGPCASPAV